MPHQPQPGPNVIIRDIPQRPVFVAGYPKPAHIPPIERDAEEIPTNPAKIPPLPATPKGKDLNLITTKVLYFGKRKCDIKCQFITFKSS